jgi:Ribbon-helix-helix protein, copG family
METSEFQLDEETLARARRLAAARRVTVGEIIKEALEQLETAAAPDDPILGMFADVPELMDEIVEEAMQSRERHPLRSSG